MVLLDYTWTSGWLKRGRIDGVEDIDGVAVAMVDGRCMSQFHLHIVGRKLFMKQ